MLTEGDLNNYEAIAARKYSFKPGEVVTLIGEIRRLQAAIRQHRDQRGDDRCWMDDETLYKVLPEGYVPPERDVTVELAQCERYLACRRNPATVYISPQRRIEELEYLLHGYEKCKMLWNRGMDSICRQMDEMKQQLMSTSPTALPTHNQVEEAGGEHQSPEADEDSDNERNETS